MTRKVLVPVSDLLDSGNCEPFKAAVHGVVLALAAVCATYNAAAWVKRRQRHLAVNAIFYGATVWFEHCHVRHHLAACGRAETPVDALTEREAA
jgi:hypothetical protein